MKCCSRGGYTDHFAAFFDRKWLVVVCLVQFREVLSLIDCQIVCLNMPYLKEADSEHLSRDSMGQRLVYGDVRIICANDSFVLRDNTTEGVIETVGIKQNEEGIDTEDRVIVLKQFIRRFGSV